jgi:hypothetical protein
MEHVTTSSAELIDLGGHRKVDVSQPMISLVLCTALNIFVLEEILSEIVDNSQHSSSDKQAYQNLEGFFGITWVDIQSPRTLLSLTLRGVLFTSVPWRWAFVIFRLRFADNPNDHVLGGLQKTVFGMVKESIKIGRPF